MATTQVSLADVFKTASKALAQHQSELNQADSYNSNHGDNMVQIFNLINQAIKAKKTSDAPTQLEHAAKLVSKETNSGSASVIVDGLMKAAEQITGKKISIDMAFQLLQLLLNGGKQSKNEPNDLLGSLLTGFSGGGNAKKADDGFGLDDMLGVGLGLLQGAKSSGIDLGELAGSLVSQTEMGKSEHRSQSGQLIASAVLAMLTDKLND